MKRVVIEHVPGYDLQVGHLVSMIQLVRETTTQLVRNLSPVQLDVEFEPSANSIGTLLWHIGAMEFFVLRNIFRDGDRWPGEIKKWRPGLSENLPKKLIRGFDLDYYLGSLDEVRSATLELLASVTDEWLYRETPVNEWVAVNNYQRIFHLAEDEISHCGQIRYIRKRLPAAGGA
jgi:hypothetical protein